MDLSEVRDYAQIVSAVGTLGAVLFAALALWLSARTFKRQTDIQANQAAHNATDTHLRLRAENPDIIRIEAELEEMEEQLEESPDRLSDLLDRTDYNLYVTIAEHGIGMAEYIYKDWRKDLGWRHTVESWILTYRAFLLDRKLDCADWEEDFLQFIEDALIKEAKDSGREVDISRDDFCL
jgi:hypothetical protein